MANGNFTTCLPDVDVTVCNTQILLLCDLLWRYGEINMSIAIEVGLAVRMVMGTGGRVRRPWRVFLTILIIILSISISTALRKKDGAFIINGNWALNWPGDFEGAGTTFSYVRGDVKNLEGITSLGPVREPLDLMVSRFDSTLKKLSLVKNLTFDIL